jgi:hypothetical protein
VILKGLLKLSIMSLWSFLRLLSKYAYLNVSQNMPRQKKEGHIQGEPDLKAAYPKDCKWEGEEAWLELKL